MKKTFCIIGLDAFGISLCKELSSFGENVIAFDTNESNINKVSEYSSRCASFDYTDKNLLIEMGIKHVDYAIIAIIDDIKASILVTLILKELGIPKIIVEAEDEYHEKVVKKLGADITVSPSVLTGIRVARRIVSEGNVLDYYNLSDEYGLYEIQVPHDFVDKKLSDMDIRNKYSVNIVLIKSGSEYVVPKGHDILKHDDILMIIGKHKAIMKFQQSILSK